MKLPSDLQQLLFTIKSAKPESKNYLVGGCVRDFLLGKAPKDFDIVTDVSMDDLEDIFKRSDFEVDTIGKKFLVLVIRKENNCGNGPYSNYEIANFRKEGTYIDGRRPEEVDIGTIEDDANRRDFTMNALYYDTETKEIFSPIKTALVDLGTRTLKFIGNPKDRIQEDYLRVFRYYRFLREKGLQADNKSMKACRTFFDEAIKSTSPERIRNEIERML